MTGFDGYSDAEAWEHLTNDEARNPLPAIYEVQVKITDVREEVEKLKLDLIEHERRLEFLRGVIRMRLGD